jgi:N-acetylmuramoyl-L-alanine amidase
MSYLPDSRVTAIVIHYSATSIERSYTAADIDAMHKARGFNEIGYHFFIRRDGTVETGRDLSQPGRFEVGAHSQGENSSSIGICYEGGVRASAPTVGFDSRTPAQTAAMIGLIRDLLVRFPGAIVRGHREMPGAATQCPGFTASAWWDEVLREDAADTTEPALDVKLLRWRLAEVRDRALNALMTGSDAPALTRELAEIRDRITDRIGR